MVVFFALKESKLFYYLWYVSFQVHVQGNENLYYEAGRITKMAAMSIYGNGPR